MLPSKLYKQLEQSQALSFDPAQVAMLPILDMLHTTLLYRHNHPYWTKFQRYFNKRPHEQGLYLWGSVGRGKTFLMDVLFDSLPFKQKLRLHFYAFMRQIHAALKLHESKPNPLEIIGREWAKQYHVLCLDEFLVKDIADAMILHALIRALFQAGVFIVTTSNTAVNVLYFNGLQRARFLPAIDLLEAQLQVVHLDTVHDHRLRPLTQSQTYWCPDTPDTDVALTELFKARASRPILWKAPLSLAMRILNTLAISGGAVWFHFDELCRGPRSQNDYIVLSEQFVLLYLTHVPAMGQRDNDPARRFIMLIDTLYDARRKVILSAAVPLEALYGQGDLQAEFMRTRSRLQEMQSDYYLALPPRAVQK